MGPTSTRIRSPLSPEAIGYGVYPITVKASSPC